MTVCEPPASAAHVPPKYIHADDSHGIAQINTVLLLHSCLYVPPKSYIHTDELHGMGPVLTCLLVAYAPAEYIKADDLAALNISVPYYAGDPGR
jgi:hypothetical protein